MTHSSRFAPALLGLVALATGCELDVLSDTDPQAGRGPRADTAEEAFPGRPTGLPVLDATSASAACVRWAECEGEEIHPWLTGDEEPAGERGHQVFLQLCVNQLETAGELAIPMDPPISIWSDPSNERAEWFVNCVRRADSCGAVRACNTPGSFGSCDERGCGGLYASRAESRVVCDGDVATIVTADGRSATRDCSRSYATCDTRSETGCTDRPLTSCEPNTAPRCDGDMLLGCNEGQMSYRDCARWGGSCGEDVYGQPACVYPVDAGCESVTDGALLCAEGAVVHCVKGRRVRTPSATICGE